MGLQAEGGGARLCPVMVGRDDLLALADRRVSAALAGSGELLFLAGEAGIGKTRLLTEVSERAAARGADVFGAAAFPGDVEVAGGLLADLASELRRSVDPVVSGAGGRVAAALHEDPGGTGDAHRRHRLLVSSLADAVISIGDGGNPVLLTLEDLHWADDVTLEVFDRVARRLRALPMLVVGTYRSDELYPRTPMRAWRSRLLVQRLAEEARLPRLDRGQTAVMTEAIMETLAPAALTALVHERSDGIPLHVEELLATISPAAPEGAGLDLPDTLADAVLARASELTEPARALAAAASVIGRSFDLDLLTAVTGDDPEDIDRGLWELADRHFVRVSAGGSAYDFRHALIRDALYADLPPHQRRALHARAAAAAAAAGFGDAFVSDQYERAHLAAPAYRHALAAARSATAMSAHREAVQLYRRAQRTAPRDVPDLERAGLLSDLATELAAIDDNTAAAAAFAEAYALLRGAGRDVAAADLVPPLVAARHLLGADLTERTTLLRDALALVDAAGDQGSVEDTRVRLLAALSAAYMLDRRLDEAREHGERAHDLAARPGDQATWLSNSTTLGSVYLFEGRMRDGWPLLEGAIRRAANERIETVAARAYRMIGSSASVLVEYDRALRWLPEGIAYAERAERWNDRHYMAAHLAHVLWATGDWPAADEEARRALADGSGGITTRITALHVLGYLAMGRGDPEAADRQLGEARDLAEQMRELQRLSPALWGLAETALLGGRAEAAIEWCERGCAASESVRDAAYLFPYVVTGTRSFLALDDLSGARRWVERTGRLVQDRALPGTLPALHHARGLLHLADGHTGRARDELTLASAGWDGRRRFWEGAQALLDRARCAARSRRPAEALALANEARERSSAAGAAALLARCDAFIAERRSRSEAGGEHQVLTAREVEVARLVAGGATNREIAAALSIAPRTVAAHIEHILAKLGASRRTEIAAWAAARQDHPG